MVGASFEVEAPQVPERLDAWEPPEQAVVRLAEAKAREVARRRPCDVVVGADTVVALDGQLLGKPADPEQAREMLRRLSGRRHQVWTGLAVVRDADGRWVLHAERTDVTFRRLTEREIERYIRLGEGMDKAGGYAAQGAGALLVERIEGCFFNVVGLPLSRLAELLRGFGIELC